MAELSRERKGDNIPPVFHNTIRVSTLKNTDQNQLFLRIFTHSICTMQASIEASAV